MSDVIRILSQIESDDPSSAGRLLPLVQEGLVGVLTALPKESRLASDSLGEGQEYRVLGDAYVTTEVSYGDAIQQSVEGTVVGRKRSEWRTFTCRKIAAAQA